MNVSFNPNALQPQPQLQPQSQAQQTVPVNPRTGVQGFVQQALSGATQFFGKGRAEGGATQIMGMNIFNDMAGVKDEDSTKLKQKTVRDRAQTSVQQRSRNAQRKNMTRINLKPEEDETPIREAATGAVLTLQEKGKEGLEEECDQQGYDPLQKYALLHNALTELKEQDLPANEKQEMTDQLNQMMADHMAKHRDEIRRGLKDQSEIAAAVQAMGGGASLRELRFLYGAKGTGMFDSPLTPLAMAKALYERFGAENFNSGMASLRSRMSSEFNMDTEKGMNPRFWLCMTDASAFNAVQSTYAISTELRHDLVEKANVMPRATHAAVSVSLLNVVEAGKAKVPTLINQIHEPSEADPVTKGRVIEQVLLAIRKLPPHFWALDKNAQRLEVLEDLSKQIGTAYRGMPILETGVERAERGWRADWYENQGQYPAREGAVAAHGPAAAAPGPAAAPARVNSVEALVAAAQSVQGAQSAAAAAPLRPTGSRE
jgi:hypothetical protein